MSEAFHMNISTSYTANQYGAAQSILRTANKQPELALELIMKTAQNLQSAGGMQSAPATVQQTSPVSTAVGQLIDIMA